MIVYRLGKCAFIDDLTGYGAARFPGRWNNKGTRLVYAASSRALAVLESLAHLGGIMPVQNYCLLELEIPDTSIARVSLNELPVDWMRNPPLPELKTIGDRFILESGSIGLLVPSVIVPEEFNMLINSRHPDFGKIKVVSKRNFSFDNRLVP